MVHLEQDGTVRLVSHPLREGAERMHHDEIPILEGSPLPDR